MNKATLYALSAMIPLGGISAFICWRQQINMGAIGISILLGVVYAVIGTRAALHFNVNGLPQPPHVVLRTASWLFGIGIVLGFGAGFLLTRVF